MGWFYQLFYELKLKKSVTNMINMYTHGRQSIQTKMHEFTRLPKKENLWVIFMEQDSNARKKEKLL